MSKADYAKMIIIPIATFTEKMPMTIESNLMFNRLPCSCEYKKVQVGKDQEKAQSEKDSHSKNQGGKKPN